MSHIKRSQFVAHQVSLGSGLSHGWCWALVLSHPLSTRLVSGAEGSTPVRLPEEEGDAAIAEASGALEVLPTGQVGAARRARIGDAGQRRSLNEG